MSTSTQNRVHQEVTLSAPAARIYEALMDAGQHAAFTGGGACSISRDPGGEFSQHGGRIVGRNIELVPGRRIVQAWRSAAWPEGAWSLVRFELSERDGATHLTLDHDGLPDGAAGMIASSWTQIYWEPLVKFLA